MTNSAEETGIKIWAIAVTVALAFVLGGLIESRTGWIPYGGGVSYDATAREGVNSLRNELQSLGRAAKDDDDRIRDSIRELRRECEGQHNRRPPIGSPQGQPFGEAVPVPKRED